jgi:hypothetical protein
MAVGGDAAGGTRGVYKAAGGTSGAKGGQKDKGAVGLVEGRRQAGVLG